MIPASLQCFRIMRRTICSETGKNNPEDLISFINTSLYFERTANPDVLPIDKTRSFLPLPLILSRRLDRSISSGDIEHNSDMRMPVAKSNSIMAIACNDERRECSVFAEW